jgi:hypothetical protein
MDFSVITVMETPHLDEIISAFGFATLAVPCSPALSHRSPSSALIDRDPVNAAIRQFHARAAVLVETSPLP